MDLLIPGKEVARAFHLPAAAEPFPRHRTLLWTVVSILCAIALAVALRRGAILLWPPVASAGPTAGLDAAFAARRALTLIHIMPAALFVLLIPVWLLKRVWERPPLHRRLSYALVGIGSVVGVTAVLLSGRPVGGLNEASAAVFYDGLFLFSLGRAGWTLHGGRTALSQSWMMRAFAVLLGIATTRPVMGVFFATERITHLSPAQFFGIAFWIGFSLTYVLGEAYLRTRGRAGA